MPAAKTLHYVFALYSAECLFLTNSPAKLSSPRRLGRHIRGGARNFPPTNTLLNGWYSPTTFRRIFRQPALPFEREEKRSIRHESRKLLNANSFFGFVFCLLKDRWSRMFRKILQFCLELFLILAELTTLHCDSEFSTKFLQGCQIDHFY